MSSSDRESPSAQDTPPDERSKGPNLVLLYSLVALALVAAIGVAILIVLPFYNRR